MSKINDQIALRAALPTDLPFIYSSWLKSYRHSYFAKNITNTIYFKEHHDIIESLLDKSQIVIACDKHDQTQIFGYMVANFVDNIFTVHYLYVKHPYRKLGLGSTLLRTMSDLKTLSCYTHETSVAQRLAAKYNFVYHPYLMVLPEDANCSTERDSDDMEDDNGEES